MRPACPQGQQPHACVTKAHHVVHVISISIPCGHTTEGIRVRPEQARDMELVPDSFHLHL
jgi:hypothetical protein